MIFGLMNQLLLLLNIIWCKRANKLIKKKFQSNEGGEHILVQDIDNPSAVAKQES